MIIQEVVSAPVHTSIGATPSKFKIKASAKAFKILSGFYSEPILAIPRELGANAWDAHVKAGNTKQMFEVHAPNNLEPWFAIRDFGTGLSPADIDQIYTTYFESTKTQDNDSDGCMGLGSKTPFNYTENFTVTSYFNGTKHVYNCFIDENGSPNILPVIDEPTKEHNGLEIKFGVKIADISMFVEKVQRAYEPFRFRPVIKGASIIFKPREYAFEGNNWAMRKNNDRYSRGECRAFMGNYSYPINYESLRGYIGDTITDRTLSNQVYSVLSNGHFDFFFNIGDLEVAPNKEQLQYDADHKTAMAIVERAKVAFIELKAHVAANLKVPKTMWEAMSLHVKYNSYNGEFNHLRNVIGNIEVKFGNEIVDSGNLSVDTVSERCGLIAKNADPYSANRTGVKFTVGVLTYRAHSDKFVLRERGHYNVTEKGDIPIFLYTSEEALKKARVRHYLKTKFPNGNVPDTMLVIDQSKNFKNMKAHQAYLGLPDDNFVHIEDLPKPPRVPREARTAQTDEIFYIEVKNIDIEKDRRYHSSPYWYKKANTFNGADTYYFVDFRFNDNIWKDKTITDSMGAVLRYLRTNKVVDEAQTIWGINRKNKHLLKVGTWVNIVDLVEKAIVTNKHKEKIEQTLYMASLDDSINRLANVRKFAENSGLTDNIKNKEFARQLKGLIKLNAAVQNISADFHSLSTLFNIKAKMHEAPEVDVKEFEKVLATKYMNLFSMLDHYNCVGTKIATIINFIDENS